MIRIGVQGDTSNLDKLQRLLPDAVDQSVRETAFKIQRDAQIAAPIDTGALRASIFTVTHNNDPGPAALTKAARLRRSRKLTEAWYPKAARFQARVVVGMRYGRHVNYGTSRMPARPFLTQAAWKNRRELRKAIRAKLEASMKGGKL